MNDSYIHIRRSGERIDVSGSTDLTLGHPIDLGDGKEPDGVFVRWTWDGASLRVGNCRYGYFPLFYFVRHNEICVSTSIPRLLSEGAPAELDTPALATFIRLGYYLGDDTPFAAIRALPPHAVLTWEQSGLRISHSTPKVERQQMGRDDALEAYVAAFRNSMRRRLPSGKFSLPLSGGRDSRHILLELHQAGLHPNECITVPLFPPRGNEDIEIASMLAGTLGERHLILPAESSQVRAEWRKNILTSFCADEHAWAMPLVDYVRDNVRCLYDGLGGDILSAGGFWKPEFDDLYERGQLDALARLLVDKGNRWGPGVLEGLLRPAFLQTLRLDVALERIVRELERYRSFHYPMASFSFWNRIRREIALYSFGMLPHECTVLTPFLDHEVFDLLASLPPSTFADGTFHTEAIHRGYPEFASIPFDRKVRSRSLPSGKGDAAQQLGRSHYRRLAWESALLVHDSAPSDFLQKSFLLPRLLRCARECNPTAIDWLNPAYSVYLLQLEAFARQDPADMSLGATFPRVARDDEIESTSRSILANAGCEPALFDGSLDPLQPYWLRQIDAGIAAIHGIVGHETPFVLVDDDQWSPFLPDGHFVLPCMERDGAYWGPPNDDQSAIVELERLRGMGAEFLVVAEPSFWWLDHYAGFKDYLRARYRCIVETDLVVAFDIATAR